MFFIIYAFCSFITLVLFFSFFKTSSPSAESTFNINVGSIYSPSFAIVPYAPAASLTVIPSVSPPKC